MSFEEEARDVISYAELTGLDIGEVIELKKALALENISLELESKV